ncbi:MAG: hypothetical protein Q9227_003360 [Pyrenula ochraceoflavens]
MIAREVWGGSLCTAILAFGLFFGPTLADPMYCIGRPLDSSSLGQRPMPPNGPNDKWWSDLQAKCSNENNHADVTTGLKPLNGFFFSSQGWSVQAYPSTGVDGHPLQGSVACSDRFGRDGKKGGDVGNIVTNCDGSQGAFNHQSSGVNNGLTFLFYDPIGVKGQQPAG